MNRPPASQFDQELLDLYDDYAHSRIGRRDFLERASRFAAGGLTAAALLEILSPNYAWATQIPKDDPRLKTETAEYDSPKGAGKMKGYLAKPANLSGKRAGVIVVHENRGLNPYIEDVVRRVAVEGYVAFGPDALTPLGGYPGDDEKGKDMQAKRKPEEITEDFVAGAEWLAKHPDCNGKIGVVGFWQNTYAQEVLRRWVVQHLDGQQVDGHDLFRLDRLSEVADRVVELAKANHSRLVQ